MKKIFSAFLLMTMMVFSVGSFVSCSDLENEIAKVDTQANANAAAIESLNSEIAALKTALSAAQADADAAMTAAKAAKEAGDAAKAEAEAAKAAAAQAKAEALAAVAEELEAIQTAIAVNVEAITNLGGSVNANAVEIEALQEEVKALQTAAAEAVYAITNLNGSVEKHENAIADLEAEVALLKATIAKYEENLKELNLFHEQYKTDIQGINYAITNLSTAVETNSADIDGLTEQFEAVVAQVEELNEALVAVYNVLSALTKQIQSLVYVPTNMDGTAVAQAYQFGSGKTATTTDLLVKMTYEVSPKGLASAITSENAAFSTVPVTKAADAEYFKAQVLSADPATGRVVVYAHIPVNEKSPAFAALADKSNDTNVALSLNVADTKMISLLLGDEPEIVDAGSYVQSTYVAVKPNETLVESVYNLVDWYNKTKKNNTVEVKDLKHEVAWNLASSSTRELFSNYEVRVYVDGVAMTVAEASEFFGQEVKVAYGVSSKFYSTNTANNKTEITATPASENNPFTVTGKDLSATAQFANVKNVKDGALVGYNADVTVNVYVNGVTATTANAKPAKSLTANYLVTDRQAQIVLADVVKPWVYTDGDDAIVPTQEIDVLASGDNSDFAAFLSEATWKKNPTAEWKYIDADGKEQTAKATAIVTPKSKKAVEVSFNNGVNNGEKKLTYAQAEEATYTFTGVVNKNKVDYTVTFNVKLGAMPADLTVDLNNGAPFQLNASLGTPMVIKDLTPATQTIAHIQAVDKNFPALATISRHSDGHLSDLVFKPVSVTVKEGNEASATKVALYLSHDNKGDDTKEVSTLTLSELTKYDNTLDVVYTYEVAGVTVKYTATIVTKKPELSFKPAVAYVTPENKVNLDGTVKFNYGANKSTVSATDYELNAIDLRNYVDVTIPEALANDFYIRYTLKSNPFVKEVKADGTVVMNKNPETEQNFTRAEYPSFSNGTPVVNDDYTSYVKLIPTEKCPVSWNSDMREMTYEIALVSKTQVKNADNEMVDDVFASFDVTLVIPELIKTFAADKQMKVKYENGATAASTNIAKAFNIIDKFDNVIYNAYARSYSEMWLGYELNKKGELVDVTSEFFNAYGQNIVFDTEGVKAYKGTIDVTSQVNPVLNPRTGALTIKAESATLTGDIEVKVPATLTYMYDEYGKQAKKTVVSVLFTLAGEGEVSGDVSIEDTPDLKQWNLGTKVFADNWVLSGSSTDELVDAFGTAEIPAILDFGVSAAYWVENKVIKDENTLYFAANWGVSSEQDYWMDQGRATYVVEPTDATSGYIKLGVSIPDGNADESDVKYIKYSNHNGETCDFDIAELLGFEESYVVTATLVKENVQVIMQ